MEDEVEVKRDFEKEEGERRVRRNLTSFLSQSSPCR